MFYFLYYELNAFAGFDNCSENVHKGLYNRIPFGKLYNLLSLCCNMPTPHLLRRSISATESCFQNVA
jgi:hypothetical protein